ncbi:MAG: NAD(P)(+) transhydrogenase (Re/Si-specific) subunit alpha, partial [Myxococcaceae bacterium]|nr:NAD(P)(+) transhydrogenase (Re/Si-specific) subunit alpha [Myxococcaceae bacterium]
MRIAVPRELVPGERRVALVPETVKKLVARNLAVHVLAGAGEAAGATDEEYRAAGATLVDSASALYAQADVVVKVQPPTAEEVVALREGTTLVSLLYPLSNKALVSSLAARKVTALATDSIPRTTV